MLLVKLKTWEHFTFLLEKSKFVFVSETLNDSQLSLTNNITTAECQGSWTSCYALVVGSRGIDATEMTALYMYIFLRASGLEFLITLFYYSQLFRNGSVSIWLPAIKDVAYCGSHGAKKIKMHWPGVITILGQQEWIQKKKYRLGDLCLLLCRIFPRDKGRNCSVNRCACTKEPLCAPRENRQRRSRWWWHFHLCVTEHDGAPPLGPSLHIVSGFPELPLWKKTDEGAAATAEARKTLGCSFSKHNKSRNEAEIKKNQRCLPWA